LDEAPWTPPGDALAAGDELWAQCRGAPPRAIRCADPDIGQAKARGENHAGGSPRTAHVRKRKHGLCL